MRTSFTFVSVLGLASAALGQSCAQASRFGNSVVTTSSHQPLVAGDNYTCSAQYGIKPSSTEYLLGVYQNNNGYEAEIFLERVDSPPVVSIVTLTIPAGYYFNASYDLFVQLTYPTNGTDGTPVYVRGGQLEPLTLKPTV